MSYRFTHRPTPHLLPDAAADRCVALQPRAVVAVVAGPDPALLARCLGALALQRSAEGLWLAPDAFGVVVVPTGPAAAEALRRLGPGLPFPVRLAPSAEAPGWALRQAMAAAGDWLGHDGAILTTLAEAVPETRWVAHAVAALAASADAVAGEVVPPSVAPDAAHPTANDKAKDWSADYAALLHRLAVQLDPDPAEPHAAHGQEHPGSFAVRGAALAALGGLPARTGHSASAPPPGGMADGMAGVPALLAALRRRGGEIRHVTGMRVEADLPPAALPPLAAAHQCLLARAAIRRFWTDGTGAHAPETVAFRRWSARLGVPAGALGTALAARQFEDAWAAVAAISPALAPAAPLRPEALTREIRRARRLLAMLRLLAPARQAGRMLPAIGVGAR